MAALTPALACPVHGCGLPLEAAARALVCPRGHNHDVARSGYVNLLQPQDRRSAKPGDSREVVQARARLVAAGVGSALIESLIERIVTLPTMRTPAFAGATGSDAQSVVELGSGAGDLLATLADRRPIAGVGIDLSAAAADLAARRFPALTWVVANADRRLPLLDGSVALLISAHARRNASEAARVMSVEGMLIVAVPAADDLIELREQLHGEALSRDRIEGVIAEHAPTFEPFAQWTVRDRRRLSHDQLLDLLLASYRGQRHRSTARMEKVDHLDVTLASDIVVMRRRG